MAARHTECSIAASSLCMVGGNASTVNAMCMQPECVVRLTNNLNVLGIVHKQLQSKQDFACCFLNSLPLTRERAAVGLCWI